MGCAASSHLQNDQVLILPHCVPEEIKKRLEIWKQLVLI